MTEATEAEPRRGPGRPRMARADNGEPIHEPVRKRERKRKGTIAIDKFAVGEAPEGMTYEWKRISVYGASDPSYEVLMRDQGWEPVDASRHPEMVSGNARGPIVRDGLMLMERPVELTEEARAEERQSARVAVAHKEQQLGHAGPQEFGRDNKGTPLHKVSRSYEPIAIDGD